MDIFIKHSTRAVVGPRGEASPAIAFKRRELALIRLTFLDDSLQPFLPDDVTAEAPQIKFGFKANGHFGGGPVALMDAWEYQGAAGGHAFVGNLSLNTDPLNNGLFSDDEIASVSLMGEFIWRKDEGPFAKSGTLIADVSNDILRGDEAPPAEDLEIMQSLVAQAQAAKAAAEEAKDTAEQAAADAVDAAGNAANAATAVFDGRTRSGVVAIEAGVGTVNIVFQPTYPAGQKPAISLDIERPEGGDFLVHDIVSRTNAGFTVKLTGPAPAAGYFLHYNALLAS